VSQKLNKILTLTEHDLNYDKQRTNMGVRSGPKIPTSGSEFELVTNGTNLVATTGWTALNSGTLSVVNGALRVTPDSGGGTANSGARQDIPTVSGESYTITLHDDPRASGNTAYTFVKIMGGGMSGSIETSATFSSATFYEHTFVATGSTTSILLYNGTATAGYYVDWSNISVKPAESPLVLSLDAANAKSYAGDPVTNMLAGETVNGHGSEWTASTPPGSIGSVTTAALRKNFFKLHKLGLANCFGSATQIYRNTVNNPATSDSASYNNNSGINMTSTINQTSGTDDGGMIISFWRYLAIPYDSYQGSDGLGQAYISYTNSSGSSEYQSFANYSVDGTYVSGHTAGEEKLFGNTADIGKWQYVQLRDASKISSGSNASQIRNFYIYTDRTKQGQMYVAELMLEDRNDGTSYAIPYTSSSRSASAGWKDLSHNVNHGTLTNGAKFGRNHYIAQEVVYCDDGDDPPAIDFDATNDQVVIGHISDYTAARTWALWFKLDSIPAGGAYKSIFYSTDDWNSPGGISLQMIYGNFKFSWGTSWNSNCAIANSELSTGVWYHFVGTSIGDTTSDGVKMYLNGELRDTGTATQIPDDTPSNLIIGGGAGGTMDGKIATFQVYSTELSHEQVKSMYNSQKSRFGY
jgi:hypothetical protein